MVLATLFGRQTEARGSILIPRKRITKIRDRLRRNAAKATLSRDLARTLRGRWEAIGRADAYVAALRLIDEALRKAGC